MIRERGLRSEGAGFNKEVEFEDGRVGGAERAAREERWRVTAFRPIKR
jgi:hypothetical protein